MDYGGKGKRGEEEREGGEKAKGKKHGEGRDRPVSLRDGNARMFFNKFVCNNGERVVETTTAHHGRGHSSKDNLISS